MAKKKTKSDNMPSKADILAFVESADGKVGKREIARAFYIKGAERIVLKKLLKEMASEGLLQGARKRLRQPGSLPSVTLIDIIAQDEHGDYYGHPAKWNEAEEGAPPKVLLGASKRPGTPAGIGERVLGYIEKIENPDGYTYSCRPIKKISREARRLLGVFEANPSADNRTQNRPPGGVIQPIDRKHLKSWSVDESDINGAQHGELVGFETISHGRFGPARARIKDRLGNLGETATISLIAVHTHGLPDQFPRGVIEELEGLSAPNLKGRGGTAREDLRHIPLITIDPSDARDHDDAVWAARDEDSANPGGWVVIVAIADVAHYVRAGSELDREALKRGNSAYFPDRVVPMLPERISNDLCSLIEGKERPSLAVRMVFDKNGQKIRHTFIRAMIKSAAKLSYQQAQQAIDGKGGDKTAQLLEPVLKPLWQAYEALKQARHKRCPLELDLPERKIIMNNADDDNKGTIKRIYVPERLEAHKLIEEFMIQANVAAAETLEKQKIPFIYRVHDAPSNEKLKALKDFLASLDIKIAGSGPLKPQNFNGILRQTKGTAYEQLISVVVLRSQAQAEYSPQNFGHFGLNLRRYAHFTSPIRRYADLIVHRALITSLKLGDDGLREEDLTQLDAIAEEISGYERRAMKAERETVDRLIAAHLSSKIGREFNGRIAGVARSGLFVQLAETGADGYIPAATLGRDYYVYDEPTHALVGETSGETFQLGQEVDVRLVEAIPTAGALRFEMLSKGVPGKKRRGRAGHPRKKTGYKKYGRRQ